MAFGKDKTNFLLKSLDLYKGVIDPTTDALGSGVLVGYTMPEKTITMSRQFAEFFDGIPEYLVRKDVTRVQASMDLELVNWSTEHLELTSAGEKLEDEGGYDYVFLGSEPTTQNTSGYWLKGETVDGKEIIFAIRQGRITTEDTSIATGSGEHQSLPIKIEAEVDENVTDLQRNLCFWRLEN